MVRMKWFSSWHVFEGGWMICWPLISHCLTDEEEEENTEDQDERGNLRGLIDDAEEEEEAPAPAPASAAGSDSEEEVKHRRKKRSKWNRYFKEIQPWYSVLLHVVVSFRKSPRDKLYWISSNYPMHIDILPIPIPPFIALLPFSVQFWWVTHTEEILENVNQKVHQIWPCVMRIRQLRSFSQGVNITSSVYQRAFIIRFLQLWNPKY